MKITEIKYTTKGPMGIKYHFTAIATDEGLERALRWVGSNTVTSKTEKEVESLKEYLGCSSDRFKSYFMEGVKRVENTEHFSTGTVYSVTYS